MRRLFLMPIICLLLTGWVKAQNDEPGSLYFTIGGNLYAYTDEHITLLLEDGYADQLNISSDGSMLVYRTVAPEVLAANGPTLYQDIPRSIILVDTVRDTVQRITTQPAHASDSIGIIRNNPTFSPDGQQISWWEVDYQGEPYSGTYRNHRLVIYNIDSGETMVRLADVENPPAVQGATLYEIGYELLWWGDGIAYRTDETTTVLIDDTLLRLPDVLCSVDALRRLEGWVQTAEGEHYLGYTVWDDTAFYLIDPRTEECFRTESPPLYQATNAPDDSLQLGIYPIDGDVSVLNALREPVLTLPDLFSHLSRNRRFTLSPDGRTLAAYHRIDMDSENDITIWDGDGYGVALGINTLEPGNLPDNLPYFAWGTLELVLPPNAELTRILRPE